jgi:hypothetical protein
MCVCEVGEGRGLVEFGNATRGKVGRGLERGGGARGNDGGAAHPKWRPLAVIWVRIGRRVGACPLGRGCARAASDHQAPSHGLKVTPTANAPTLHISAVHATEVRRN